MLFIYLCALDLECSPLLVDALAEKMLLTPRGSIYAREWVQPSLALTSDRRATGD